MRQPSENAMNMQNLQSFCPSTPVPQPVSEASASVQPYFGLVEGTLLLTQRGEVAVEDLQSGDKVISRNSGFARLTNVTQTSVQTHMVSIAAGSLGHTRPEQDILVPAGQHILIRDWRAQAMFGKGQAMVAADELVDGEFVLDVGLQQQRIYHLEFDTPQVIYAGGLEIAGGDWSKGTQHLAA